MDRILLLAAPMTTCEWIYSQTLLVDMALDGAQTPAEREFLATRLRELKARVRFEQRLLARSNRDASGFDRPDEPAGTQSSEPG